MTGQDEKLFLEEGNSLFSSGKYEEALVKYDEALEINPDYYQAEFNKGDALYKSEKYADAINQFEKVTTSDASEDVKSSAYHNIGNAQVQVEKYQEAVDAYKKSLRLNPADQDTRRNLSYAQRQLQQQNQQNKEKQDNKDQQQDKDDEKDQQDQKDKESDKGDQDKSNKEGDKKDSDQKDEQNSADDNKKDQDKSNKEGDKEQKGDGSQDKKDPRQQVGGMSKQDAERLLEAINEQEAKTQGKIIRGKVKTGNSKIEKDW